MGLESQRKWASALLIGACGILALPLPAAAADTTESSPAEDWSIHGQATGVYQAHPDFPSPFQGPNSLSGNTEIRETLSFTAFLGARLPWAGGAFYVNPEINQGSGFNHTTGLAGFSNGEAQKANSTIPRVNDARVFLRQTFGLGGAQETLAPGPNQLGESVDIARLTVTVGKLAIPDLFDDNAYSHDPRTQFLNWSLMDAGAYDYAADQKGYTDGLAVELNEARWALRGGYFLVPDFSNSNDLDSRLLKFGGAQIELELRYDLAAQPGKLRLLGFANRIFAGNFRDALAVSQATGLDINQALVEDRRPRTKYGFVVNAEQALDDTLGLFSRFSWNDGKEEIMSFTDITESLAFGMSLNGARWGRPHDAIGLAGVLNMLSAPERDFLAAGGLGILVGDGQLHYATEDILETYYSLALAKTAFLTLDYQFVDNPAYNQPRGPVHIFTARLHVEF